MPSLFSKIISGDVPGHFVWRDDDVVAFLTIAPLRPGHTLVVPRAEIASWTELDGALLSRCTEIAQAIGSAVEGAWDAPRSGLIVAGFEVAHVHFHVFPTWGEGDFDFGRAKAVDQADLAEAAVRIRAGLRALGHGEHVADA